jgi:2-iminobutanoate/2-iminopropanoate deaminase
MHRHQLTPIVLALACLAQSPPVLSADAIPAVEFLNSGKVLPRNVPFSEIVRHGNTLYLSGQIGNQPGTMQLVPGGLQEEAKRAMENVKLSLEAHGYSMGNLMKCTVMLADIADWAAFNDIYKSFFPSQYPARSVLAASGLALGARVEVDCIAAAVDRTPKAKPGRV